MKKLLVSFALVVGLVGMSHASHSGGGWRSFTVITSSVQVFSGFGFINSISLSTGCSQGDFAIALDTVAGVGLTNMNDALSVSTMGITPPILFGTTTTANSGGIPANNYWTAGQAADDYIELMNGLFILKSTAASGACGRAVVYYTR